MTLHTTRKLLRQAGACADRYKVFLTATKAQYGDNNPIPLAVALDSNGLSDTIWALRAVLPGEEAERDRVARLFACDCAERVLPVFEVLFPKDLRPRKAIEVSRRFALGGATVEELRAAGAVPGAAAEAAWAWAAGDGGATEEEAAWQTEHLRQYLEGRTPWLR